MRRTRIIRLLVIVVILTTVMIGYSNPHWWPPSQLKPASQLPQFGEADGFALVLFYGSDIAGDLEPCG